MFRFMIAVICLMVPLQALAGNLSDDQLSLARNIGQASLYAFHCDALDVLEPAVILKAAGIVSGTGNNRQEFNNAANAAMKIHHAKVISELVQGKDVSTIRREICAKGNVLFGAQGTLIPGVLVPTR